MTASLRTEIEIAAPSSHVWRVLTDFAAYPTWNPFLRHLDGSPTVGERLTARIEPPDGMGMTLRPTVLAAEPERELRWLGHLLIPGLFDGEHGFHIEPLGPDRVRFVQEERFTGLLAPLVLRFIERGTRGGFEAMNRALKARAERPSSAHA